MTVASADAPAPRRLQGVFDDEAIYAKSVDLKQIFRLLRWMRPYRGHAIAAIVMVLLSATFAVLPPTVISRVFLDDIVLHASGKAFADFGQKSLNHWLAGTFGISRLGAACVQYMVWVLLWSFFSRLYGITFGRAILNTLRDLRCDLFDHLERLPSSFS